MYTAKLRLPAEFSEVDIAHLGEGIETLAFASVRDENKSGAQGELGWTVEWMFDAAPDLENLKGQLVLNAVLSKIALPSPLEMRIEDVPGRDWLSYSYQQFPAFTVGPFFIYGSHHAKDQKSDVPDTQIGLHINAATAFGSGEHATTAGCLEAMAYLKDQGLCPWNILDMGTGSGILAIAAWKLWKTPILAVDNDPEAVRVAEAHRMLNHVPDEMRVAQGDGFAAKIVQEKKPYELIIANILAGPLRDMATDAAAVCDDNGYMVLSGILNEQANSVITAYEAQGLGLKKHVTINEWSTLILHKA